MQKDAGSITKRILSGKQTEEYFFEKYKKKFFSAVKWNIVESVGYQIIFMLHQVLLFTYCDRVLYGKIGALLAACYVVVTLVIAGFDGALLPFFDGFISSKESFRKFFFRYGVVQFFFMSGLVGLLLYGLIFSGYSPFGLSVPAMIMISVFVLIEAIKKILRQLLYLSFCNKQTAFFEVVQIAVYVTIVWTLYFLGEPFSIKIFILPFIVCSTFFCVFSGMKLYFYYQTLGDSLEKTTLSTKSFWFLRCSVLINQLTRAFFSSNFIVPLFAMHGGFKEAGIVTFANYLTHACTFFIQKITLPPAEALFSRMKKLSFGMHYRAFSLAFSLFALLTAGVGMIFFFKGRTWASSLGSLTIDHATWMAVGFFFFIHLLESVFMFYEKFFLLQEKVRLLVIGNLLTCLVCYLLFLHKLAFFTLIFSCVFVRFSFFLLLSLIIYRSKKAS